MSFSEFILFLIFGLILISVGIITFINTLRSRERYSGVMAYFVVKFLARFSPERSYLGVKVVPALDKFFKDAFKLSLLILEVFFALAGIAIVIMVTLSYFHT